MTIGSTVPHSRLPNLILAGSPKCATSSLFNWLTAHPCVCGTKQKETFYLMDRTSPLCGEEHFSNLGMLGYAKQLHDSCSQNPVRVEATTHYIYQNLAPEVIAELENVRVCFVLRDPADRLLSSFNYTKHTLARLADNVSFEQYLQLVTDGNSVYPEFCQHDKSAFVLDNDVQYGKYVQFLKVWLNKIDRSRIKIILFEDLQKDPGAAVRQILDQFDIDLSFYENYQFERRNVTSAARFQRVHRLLKRVRDAALNDLPVPSMIRTAYRGLQSRGANASILSASQETMNSLREYYLTSNKELENLLGISLQSWYPK